MTMARYSGVVQDQAGNIISNAKIEVRRETPGAPLAVIKEDRDGLVALANPFNAESDGTFFFHVVGGFYKIRAYTGASASPTFEQIIRYQGIGELQGYDLDAVLIGKRQQVRVATTANITIPTALNNGDAIDGVTLATNDLVLVKNQTSKAQNGVYVVGVTPARSAEFDTYNEHAGAMVAVVEGTIGAGSVWFCTANSGGALGTTAIDFTELAATAGPPGADGEQGPPGPATITIGAVTTLAAGEDATVTNSGDDENFILDFGIPEGEQGAQGIQGEQGIQGPPGADGSNGADGADGSNGADGDDGWSPVFSIETDSARRVLRVVDWVGGEGTKPATGEYVGASGLESSVGGGVDIRGPQGAAGAGSGDMEKTTYDPNDDGKFSNAQLDNMPEGTVKMRRAGAGAGAPTDTTLANLKADLALNNVTNDAQVPLSYLDTDGTLAANSDTKIATQKAVRSAINALLGANDAEVFKGAIDCSANPNYPAADAGHVYRVSVAGKIGGASGINVEVNDRLQCIVDGTASGNHATVGANWWITQANIDGAVIGPANATDATPAVFDGVTGKLIKNISFSAFKTGLSLVAGDVGLGNVTNVAQLPLSYLDTDTTLAANSDTKVPSQKAIKAYVAAHSGGSGGLISTVAYTSTQTVTIPTGATRAEIQMWGGSGGGGGVDSGGGTALGGGGAGGIFKVLTSLTAGNTLAFTAGSAGAAGSTSGTAGGTGGSSTLASGTQTITTLTASGGVGGSGTLGSSTPSGGTGTNGDINIFGQPGGMASSGNASGTINPGGTSAFGMSVGGNGARSVGGGAVAGIAGTIGGMIIRWYQ